MTLPSDYSPTGLPIFQIGPSNKTIIEGACIGASLGITYGAGYLQYEDFRDFNTNTFYYNERNNSYIINKLKLYSDNLPRKGLFGIRPKFLEQQWQYFAVEDGLTYAPQTTNQTFVGVTNNNYYYASKTGYILTAWPVQGISNSHLFLHSFIDTLAANGVTIDFSMMDYEAAWYDWIGPDKPLLDFVTGLTQYSSPYYGLSSWKDIFESFGGCGAQTFSAYGDSWWAWKKAANIYTAEVWNQTLGNYLLSKYPDAIFSNYDYYTGEKVRNDESPESNGFPWPQSGYVGNAGSPVLYGRMRLITTELTTGGSSVRYNDPTRFYLGDTKRIQPLVSRTYEIAIAPDIVQSPVTSFLQAMTEVRTAKRNAPNVALAPWINTINTCGYYFEGHMFGKVYPTGNFQQPTSGRPGQSPAEVLHNSWYSNNISSLQRGFTNYDGSTSGFRLRTPVLTLMENAWYKQNMASLTFDGATTSFAIRTSGVTGTTAALAYYYNSITAGVTYIFSYFIDMDRGFTALNGRFTTWTTSETSTNAPSLTTTNGITFEQILPVTGGQVFRQSPVSYNVGDSGWTQVAWRFVGTSNPRVALHAYHASNIASGGHTAYIKDVKLEIQGVSSNTLVNINAIGSTATASNSLTSLEYYYNGLTYGTTYVFSYYTDPSRGYTGTNRTQKFNNFAKVLYDEPIGITYNQVLPINVNSLYHTAGISYGSISGWTKMSWEFSVSVGDTYDPLNRNTVSASVACVDNIYSVMDSENTLGGVSLFISSPSLEIKSTPSNISLPVVDFDYETIALWQWGPAIGWGDVIQGPNRDKNVYLVNRPGNSAYFYELVRHCCLLGTKGFGVYNPEDYINCSVTGSITEYPKNSAYGNAALLYRRSGLTQHITALKLLDETLHDINNRLGGHTTSTAITERVNWLAPYIANGAPDITGNTWWWRVTALQGYTVYCNGITLSDRSQIGTWVSTTGPTLAGVGITWSKWEPPIQEPNMGSPAKDLNFVGMTNINGLIAVGCTFSRGSSASYLNSNGIVVEVGPNQPRFTHSPIDLTPQGLLVEASTTNLLNWSETFNSSGGSQNNWTDQNIIRTTGSTCPNGLTASIRFTGTAANGTIISTSAIGSTAARAFSCWLRGITGNETLYFTLDNGNTWSQVSNLSNNWKRYNLSYASSNHRVGFRIGNTGESIEIWGAQLESTSGNYLVTSYIKTLGTQVTRSADNCSISGSSFASWIGNTYGTFIIEFANGIESNILALENDSNNYLRLTINNTGEAFATSYRLRGVDGGGNVGDIWQFLTRIHCPEVIQKVALTYSPRGTKFLNYRGLANFSPTGKMDFARLWPGNTSGPPQFTSINLSSVANSMCLNRIRFWPFVFDQKNMLQMVKGNVDPTIGYIGKWDLQ